MIKLGLWPRVVLWATLSIRQPPISTRTMGIPSFFLSPGDPSCTLRLHLPMTCKYHPLYVTNNNGLFSVWLSTITYTGKRIPYLAFVPSVGFQASHLTLSWHLRPCFTIINLVTTVNATTIVDSQTAVNWPTVIESPNRLDSWTKVNLPVSSRCSYTVKIQLCYDGITSIYVLKPGQSWL